MVKKITSWGYKVSVEGVKAISCSCGWNGQGKTCDHAARAERDARINSAPLISNAGFSLMR